MNGQKEVEPEGCLEIAPRDLPRPPDRPLYRGVVNEDIGSAQPLSGIVENFWRVRIGKIAAECAHPNSRLRCYCPGGNLGERH